jgi:hypothetical protein
LEDLARCFRFSFFLGNRAAPKLEGLLDKWAGIVRTGPKLKLSMLTLTNQVRTLCFRDEGQETRDC